MAVGVIIQTMALAPGSTILELGCGWGNTTIALRPRMGYSVTAIDIDPNFVGLVGTGAEKLSLPVDIRRGGYLIDQLGRRLTLSCSSNRSITVRITCCSLTSCRRS